MSKYVEDEAGLSGEDIGEDEEEEGSLCSEDAAFITSDGEEDIELDMAVYRERDDVGEASGSDGEDGKAFRMLHRMIARRRERRGGEYPYSFGIEERRERSAEEIRVGIEDIVRSTPRSSAPVRRKKANGLKERETTSEPIARRAAHYMVATKEETQESRPAASFEFVKGMESALHKRGLKENTDRLKKVLDPQREAQRKRLVAPPRKPAKRSTPQPPRGNATIDQFFGRV